MAVSRHYRLTEGMTNADRRALLEVDTPVTVTFGYVGHGEAIQVPATVTRTNGLAEHLVEITLDDYGTTFLAHVRMLSDVGPNPRFLSWTHGDEPTRKAATCP